LALSYTATAWKDHVVAKPRTYNETTNPDGSRTDSPAPGTIIQQGTPINAANLNHIEGGILDCVDGINDLDDRKIEQTVYSVTIPTTGWSGNAAPFTLNIAVSGILAADAPLIDLVQSGTYATDQQRLESWAGITRIVTAANQLRLTATYKPTVALPIQVRCMR